MHRPDSEAAPVPACESAGTAKPSAVSRREFASCAAAAAAGFLMTACGAKPLNEVPKEQLLSRIKELERQYSKQYGTAVTVADTPPMPNVLFAYALDISRCIGCRRCVYGCVEENNQSRDPQVQWIRVLQMDKERGVDFTHADPYYSPKEVPEEGHFYVPMACQQCRNPPCTKVCPTAATWTDPDGIVVIDYDWCIGCRYCMAACPYGARHFNWGEPTIPSGQLNPKTHVLGNRPRPGGRRREVHVLYPADEERPLPGLRRGVPGRRAEVRQSARSRERDSLHHRAQARAGPEGRPEHGPQVLLLLRHVRCA